MRCCARSMCGRADALLLHRPCKLADRDFDSTVKRNAAHSGAPEPPGAPPTPDTRSRCLLPHAVQLYCSIGTPPACRGACNGVAASAGGGAPHAAAAAATTATAAACHLLKHCACS